MMAVASMGVPSGISSREATYAEAVQAASSSRLRRGKDVTEKLAEKAGEAAVEGADVFEANAYKVQLIKTLVKRELLAL